MDLGSEYVVSHVYIFWGQNSAAAFNVRVGGATPTEAGRGDENAVCATGTQDASQSNEVNCGVIGR